jgi:hypothetical protein
MNWTTLGFGKHKGKTLPEVAFCDPDWLFWAIGKGLFKGAMEKEAEEIYRKSSRIRIPQNGSEIKHVEYIIDQGTYKFGTLRILTGDIESYRPLTRNQIMDVIDMRVPRQIAPHDKLGYKNFLFAMKDILFGDPSHRMNQRRCEDFFNDASNFLGW